MRLTSVAGMGEIARSQVAFARAIRKDEERQYSHTIQSGLRQLGIENFVIGMHAPSIPADIEGRDFGIGTPYGNSYIFQDLALHGINGMQFGPNGKLDKSDRSPYVSSVFEKNPLLINPQMLVGEEFANILTQKEINSVAPRTFFSTSRLDTRALHNTRARRCNEKLLEKAFENYNKKLQANDPKAKVLKDDFNKFLEKNKSWIDYYAVLNVIANDNETDYYPNWKNQDDVILIRDVKNGVASATARFKQMQEENQDAIALYKFTQFIAAKQAEIDAKAKGDFLCIGDIEVGASKLDELVFGDVFLEGYCLGAPDGGLYNEQQFWGIKLLDPKKLFNEDGTLGASGEFLEAKLLNGLAGAKSIRIDHTIGLINPWIYNPNTVKYVDINGEKHVDQKALESTRVAYKSKEEPFEGIEGGKNFERVIPEIIIPALKKAGISIENVVWEDIGCDETGRFTEVFADELGLSGLATTKWVKGDELGDKTALMSCHDDDTTRSYIENEVLDKIQVLEEKRNEAKKNGEEIKLDATESAWDPEYLAERIYPGSDNETVKKREQYRKEIISNPRKLWKAKLVDIFTQGPKNIQLSFMDLFGISKRYNIPGTSGAQNWTLRLSPNYKENYYSELQKDDSWAINIPEIVAESLRAKATREGSLKENEELIAELNKWAGVLKEKE
ncbi:MAG: 4-alpha-glucanotransferase [Candidatus Gastranaerophilales bacterium]|nr:4-alpha-glucanotransferase [Candidatus Gastranaerophilales bacterium]